MGTEPGSQIVSAGPSGFLTEDMDGDMRWTRYADGTSTVLGRHTSELGLAQEWGSLSDTVVVPRRNPLGSPQYDGATLHDMASGAAPVEIDLQTLGREYAYVGTVGSTVIAAVTTGTGQQAHVVTKDGAALSDRAVTGLPADAQDIRTTGASEGSVLLSYRIGELGTSPWYLALVDLGTATVTETHDVGRYGMAHAAALSETHIAWFERTGSSTTKILNVAVRGGSTPPRRETVTGLDRPVLGLTGNWLTYASATKVYLGNSDYQLALTAVPVDGGLSHKLLEHVTALVPSPDGSLLAMGGTLPEGEGLYRIAPDTDGAPTTTLVASSDRPTAVTVLGHDVPSVIDLDKNSGNVFLAWHLSRANVQFTAALRHVRTGLVQSVHLSPLLGGYPVSQQVGFWWEGLLDGGNGKAVNAPNGAYTWTIEAKPRNGIGPTATASGTFTVVREPAPHDYSDNGSPDLLARDSSGRLWREDTATSSKASRTLSETGHTLVGSGWQQFNRIEAAGNLAGGPAGDLVARDTAGVLWLYQGKGDGTFATKARIGSGWQIYRHLAGASDLTGDGRPDLVATDAAGALWLYKGTGNATAPFAVRKKIGLSGWQQFNTIEATGNIAGSAAGDLVARDKGGVLWLYQGRGDGTFTTRIRIGGGWSAYNHLVGIGDANRDGRPDLYAAGSDGSTYVYESTGNAAAPFRSRRSTSVLFGTAPTYDHIA
ncbi:VCBS repeat-containing protein [Streptomyces sp. V4I23]|uniref:VCBS repeat-containing protein n=1 Tax=Streptomyces sp. V4I23 TaxID=3042282 RepID=UPI0027D77E85|nr:VCBS repeat-containing protein [Streptomyces sp. V4I23]